MMLDALRASGIAVPQLYELGLPHNNCGGGCVKAGQAHFAHLLRVHPCRFEEWEQREQELRDYLGADVSILDDRRPNRRGLPDRPPGSARAARAGS